MFCPECGVSLDENASFCNHCATQINDTPPVILTSNPPPAKRIKKSDLAMLIAITMFAAFFATCSILVYQFFWGGPRDLGIRYTQEDYENAMDKMGLEINISRQKTQRILSRSLDINRAHQKPLTDYIWSYSDFEERSFVLTPEEMTALANEMLPQFNWVEDIQINALSDGSLAVSGRVRLDLIKEDIPGISEQIPSELRALLPDTFNIYIKGEYEIVDNELQTQNLCDQIELGAIPIQPLIEGLFDDDVDNMIANFNTIFDQVPSLIIHEFKVNHDGDFEISAYMPTQIMLRD